MTFVTRITLQSGDRAALREVVSDIRTTAERKGAELKGPHSDPPAELRVPLYKRPAGGAGRQFPRWEYTVYTRRLEIVGHDDVARRVADIEYPEAVRVAVELDRVGPRT